MIKTEKKLRILRKTNRVEFWYKGEFFVYEYREDSKEGYEFIWKDQEKIYGPFFRDCTDEGSKVYNVIHKKLYPVKK